MGANALERYPSEGLRGLPIGRGSVLLAHSSMSTRRQTGPEARRSGGARKSGRRAYFSAVSFDTELPDEGADPEAPPGSGWRTTLPRRGWRARSCRLTTRRDHEECNQPGAFVKSTRSCGDELVAGLPVDGQVMKRRSQIGPGARAEDALDPRPEFLDRDPALDQVICRDAAARSRSRSPTNARSRS